MTTSDRLDAAFAALAHPTRRAILARLAQGSASVTELADPFDMSLPAISGHIRVLENAGLIDRTRSAQFRPCTLNTHPIAEISRWADQYRMIWEGRFDAMDLALRTLGGDRDD